jgi:hypothetical protein
MSVSRNQGQELVVVVVVVAFHQAQRQNNRMNA